MRNSFFVALIFIFYPAFTYGYDVDSAHAPLTAASLDIYHTCFPSSMMYRSQGAQVRLTQGNRGMDTGKQDMLRQLDLSKVSLSREEKAQLSGITTFDLAKRINNWHFYNPDRARHSRIGLVEQSHVRLWEELNSALSSSQGMNDLLFLGGLLHLTEDISVPAHSIPVYHGPTVVSFIGPVRLRPLVSYMSESGRTRGGMIKDPIDSMSLDKAALEKKLPSMSIFCSEIGSGTAAPEDVRDELARTVYKKLEERIPGCNGVSWRAFWIPPMGNEYFGKYDTAQPEFGKAGTVRTIDGMSCEMHEGDERYSTFVLDLHIDAIKADLKLLRWHETQVAPSGRQE